MEGDFRKATTHRTTSHDVAMKGMCMEQLCKLFSENRESVSSAPWVADVMFFQCRHEETAALHLSTWLDHMKALLRCMPPLLFDWDIFPDGCLDRGRRWGICYKGRVLALAASPQPFHNRPGIMHIPVKALVEWVMAVVVFPEKFAKKMI